MLPRISDQQIEIGNDRMVRSFSVAHLQMQNPLRGVDQLALVAKLAAYEGDRHGIFSRARAWAESGSDQNPAILVRDLIVHGHGYGLAGQDNLSWLLWQTAALIMINAGVDHPNDMAE